MSKARTVTMNERQWGTLENLAVRRFNYLRKAKLRKGERLSERALEMADLKNLVITLRSDADPIMDDA
jgi:hypothetical protein